MKLIGHFEEKNENIYLVLDDVDEKLVKMIRGAGSKFNDYSISPKIRQILLHWGCELPEKVFLMS